MLPELKPSVAVVMTCFNRREKTLLCLQHLFCQEESIPFALTVVLVDDASTDGTAAAVEDRFPAVHLLRGSGDLYWNRGMRMAFGWALERRFDFYVWLNDDTLLHPDAISTLLGSFAAANTAGAIITGSTADAVTGRRSYGGACWRKGWRRELIAIEPHPETLLPCDTMNGNCTLIPAVVARTLGNLDPIFHHSFGDLDYGFRAKAAGFALFLAPGFVGTCSDNPRNGTWRDGASSLRKRWAHLNSVKGSPFPEWQVYCRRHLGWLWPLYAISPYVKTVLTSLPGGRREAHTAP